MKFISLKELWNMLVFKRKTERSWGCSPYENLKKNFLLQNLCGFTNPILLFLTK